MNGRTIERKLTDLVARVAPWLAPLPTAYLTGRATVAHLHWPAWLGGAAGLIIESLGLAAVNTALELYEYNQTRRKTDPAAPFWLAALLAGVYFAAVTGLTVLLDTHPAWAIYAPLVFPLLSLSGATALALRSDQARRLETIAQERADRLAARSAARSGDRAVTGQSDRSGARSVTGHGTGQLTGQESGQGTGQLTPALLALDRVNAQAKVGKAQAVASLLDYLAAHPEASFREAGEAVGRSKAWVIGVVGELEQAGRVKRNGSGWEVFAA